MAGMKAPASSEARDRVLTRCGVKAFWQAATDEGWPFSSVFKVLLLTGQRREEVAGMRWREVDLDAGQLTIAKERAKNGKAHTIDLHPEAVRLLDPLGDAAAPRLMKAADEREYFVFSHHRAHARLRLWPCKGTARRAHDGNPRRQVPAVENPRSTAHSGVRDGCSRLPAPDHRKSLEPPQRRTGRPCERVPEARVSRGAEAGNPGMGRALMRLVSAEAPASNVVPLRVA